MLGYSIFGMYPLDMGNVHSFRKPGNDWEHGRPRGRTVTKSDARAFRKRVQRRRAAKGYAS